MQLVDKQNEVIPFMAAPMGAADISTGDFSAIHPKLKKQVPFGIEVSEDVELTVINAFGQEITQTFKSGMPLPYFLYGIKQDATVTATITYFI